LQDLTAQGHEIANHTWSHPDIRLLSPRQMRWELDRTRELIELITGRRTSLFRTPGSTEAYLRKTFRVPAGYQLVMWNVHSLDQEGISAQQIAQRVLSKVKNGDIVLMHNGLETTIASLGIIIPELRKRGFEFVTVSELLEGHPALKLAARRSAVVRG
jgi:peptidoglycan/xylan/chitin deacetylase (PgdA/CDA1 family)